MNVRLLCNLGYACYAVGMLIAGALLDRRHLRLASAVLFTLALGKALFIDHARVFAAQAHTIVNLRAAGLAAGILWLTCAAVIAHRRPSAFIPPQHAPVLVLLAHGLGVLVLTLETATFFANMKDFAASHLARQMTYSIGYSLYGCALLATGFGRRQLYLRAAGLVLFAVVLLKIFIYDLKELQELYRIFSFLALAVLLLTGAYLYYKYQHLLLPTPAKEPPDDKPR
jgi:uncharacterized membrane protein